MSTQKGELKGLYFLYTIFVLFIKFRAPATHARLVIFLLGASIARNLATDPPNMEHKFFVVTLAVPGGTWYAERKQKSIRHQLEIVRNRNLLPCQTPALLLFNIAANTLYKGDKINRHFFPTFDLNASEFRQQIDAMFNDLQQFYREKRNQKIVVTGILPRHLQDDFCCPAHRDQCTVKKQSTIRHFAVRLCTIGSRYIEQKCRENAHIFVYLDVWQLLCTNLEGVTKNNLTRRKCALIFNQTYFEKDFVHINKLAKSIIWKGYVDTLKGLNQ